MERVPALAATVALIEPPHVAHLHIVVIANESRPMPAGADVLKWTPTALAEAAGVVAFEDGRMVLPVYEAAIRGTLEGVGIGFPLGLPTVVLGRALQATGFEHARAGS
jgi:hypothetical protein